MPRSNPGRRRKGTGYQRPDGVWVVRWTGTDGRRHACTGRTAAEARRRAEQQRGEWQPAEGGTFGAFADRWLEEKRGSLKPQTWRRYEQLVRLHLMPFLGGKHLVKITEGDLDSLYSGFRARGMNPTTQAHSATVLGTMLEAARRRKLIRDNPVRNLRKPRMAHSEIHVLSASEVRRLIEASEGSRLHALYVLAVTTGMRLGELLALRWADVDLGSHVVHVHGSVTVGWSGKLEAVAPKTKRSRRDVPLAPVAVEALRTHLERSEPGKSDLLFPGRGGGYMSGSTVYVALRHLLDDAGLPRVRFHDLRHTAATLLLERGVSAHVVAGLLGHANVSTTLGVYGHVTRGLEVQAATKIQEIFATPSSSLPTP